MPHYGSLRDFSFEKDVDDIRGSALYGQDDDKLGKIQDVIFDHTSGEMKYVVVDAAGWFTHKEFLVPADRVHGYGQDKDSFQTDLTKERVDRLPKYDEKKIKSESDWADYEAEYKRAWAEDPVLHRTDRIDLSITPAEVRGEGMEASGPGVAMGSLGEDVADRDRATDEELAREDMEGRFHSLRD